MEKKSIRWPRRSAEPDAGFDSTVLELFVEGDGSLVFLPFEDETLLPVCEECSPNDTRRPECVRRSGSLIDAPPTSGVAFRR